MDALFTSLSLGMQRQARVISALIIREIRVRNGKGSFVQLMELIEALGFIVAHWIIFVYLHRRLEIGDSLLLFITTGIFPVLLFRAITIRTTSAIEAAKAVTGVPNVQALDYAIARALVEFFSYVMMFLFFFIMICQFGLSSYAIPYSAAPILQFLAMIFMLSFGVGLVNSFFISLFPAWKFCWGLVSRVQIFTSAVFFIPEYAAPPIKSILVWNPMLHMVSLFRTAFYPTYPTHLISIPYALSWAAGAVTLGFMLERNLRRRRLH